ncbi:hypothetical protein SAMN04487895_10473 [Paenibacillus sophorae]|uniref:Uncharacterized protein n=1 Tax=Paenibacillus sophorae TaxID=1333845 RepID=A0A1H8KY50_9BACL|nr:hypothetical protein SAMN04487895_10473 [Paenibacillus sophorae]
MESIKLIGIAYNPDRIEWKTMLPQISVRIHGWVPQEELRRNGFIVSPLLFIMARSIMSDAVILIHLRIRAIH